MSTSGPSEENPLADTINPYMRELKMHPKELLLKDGELEIKDVQVPKGEGSLEARMEALEQEVFKYKKMVEREVDIIHRINHELVTKTKIVSMKLDFNKRVLLQVSGYWRPRHPSLTGDLCLGSTLMIKTHPHHRRSNSSWYRHPLGLSQAWGSAAVSHHHLLLIYFSSRVIS
jgi:hypothetical protein